MRATSMTDLEGRRLTESLEPRPWARFFQTSFLRRHVMRTAWGGFGLGGQCCYPNAQPSAETLRRTTRKALGQGDLGKPKDSPASGREPLSVDIGHFRQVHAGAQ